MESTASSSPLKSDTPSLVLIVDDSRAIRGFVRDLLQKAGYEVAEAVDGEEGLAAIAALQPDVVLLDIEMPRKTGLEVLAALDPVTRLFSVIMFTTQSSISSMVDGLDRGADDYIVKPFQEAELLARVAAALRITFSKRALVAARTTAEQSADSLRHAQQQLLNEERVMAIARLSAGAAHQINNPLGFIMSNLSTLAKYTDTLLATIDDLATGMDVNPVEILKSRKIARIQADLPELLQETEQGLKRITLIVRGLSRMELGLTQQKRCVLDMNTLLTPLITLLHNEVPPGTTVHWSPAEGPLPVLGHLALLNTAFNGILDNAREAVAPGGSIAITTAASDGLAHINVINTTVSIISESLVRAFEPFYSTKNPEVHCGLGLTLAERFIASHGGSIALQLKSPGEVCATIALPLSTEPLLE